VGVAQVPGRIGDPDFGTGVRRGLSERVYGGLLRAYPARFRARYADEMIQLFADQLRDARAGGDQGGTAGIWFRTLLDLASSAVGEHLRKDRSMAHALTTFEPTRTMRLLGILGLAGGLLLLWAYVGEIGGDPANTIRLTVFYLGSAAIALALHSRLAASRPRLAFAVTAAVVFASVWNVFWILLSSRVPSAFGGTFGMIGFASVHFGWLSAAAFGAAVLWTSTVWAGMDRWQLLVTRLAGLALLIGSIATNAGDDRLGLVNSEAYGAMWQAIALTGLFLNGAGWVMLGAVLLLGNRGPRAVA
jgi:hypothetical protein